MVDVILISAKEFRTEQAKDPLSLNTRENVGDGNSFFEVNRN